MQTQRVSLYFLRYSLFFSLVFLVTSCTRTSGDDEISVIPVTNNPHIVPHGSPLMEFQSALRN